MFNLTRSDGAYFARIDEHVEACVVFGPAAEPAWWRPFTGLDYAHCWMMWTKYYPAPSLTAARWTIKLEQTQTSTHCDVWYEDVDVVAQHFLPGVTEIVKVKRRVTHDRPRSRGLINCVTLVKSALNINAPFVFSPRQLRDYLVFNLGGTPITAGR